MAAKLTKEEKARYDATVKYLSGKIDRNAIDTSALLRDLPTKIKDKIRDSLPAKLKTRYLELVPDADKQYKAAGKKVTGATDQPAATTPAAPADPQYSSSLRPGDPVWDQLVSSITNPIIDEQKKSNTERADQDVKYNRVNQVGPDGTVNWTVDPTTGQYTQTVALSPEQQALKDAETKADQAGVNQALELLNKMAGTSYNLNDVAYKMPEETDYNANFEKERQAIEADRARTREPQFQKDMADLENQLANIGVAPGSSAYATAMKQLQDQQQNQRLTDAEFARSQGYGAADSWYGRTMGNRQQGVSEYDQNATQPINMANSLFALGKGSQSPVAYNPSNVQVDGVNTMGANEAVWNQIFNSTQLDENTKLTLKKIKADADAAKLAANTSKANTATSAATSKANTAASIAAQKERDAQNQQNRDDEIAIALATGARSAPAKAGNSGYSPTGPAGSRSSAQPYQSTVKPRSVFSGGGAF
jgi:hypothetical protein